jgi:hypothetical protein
MQSVATTSDLDYYTRAANDDCFYGGPRTRTKYAYVTENPISLTDPLGLCPPQQCGNHASLECSLCLSNYLNDNYGTFGGFLADTFNLQQSIPGLSGQSTWDTLSLDLELLTLKQGVPRTVRGVGGIFNTFTTPNLAQITGTAALTALDIVGAATVPFASTALFNARVECGWKL